MQEYQAKLYAQGSKGLLVLFQAMDAGGKDGTIQHVFSGLNPQGIHVTSFKEPCDEEVAHDYLWRIHSAVPKRGMISIFNRSHYEDVLVAKVLNLPKAQGLPAQVQKGIWKKRYRQICDFEQYLTENGITVLKFFLHISQEEQRQRFLQRLENPAKQWKFATGDIATSREWDEYMAVYRDAIQATATPNAPWYVIPTDKKWYARLLVSQIVLETLRGMRLAYPAVSDAQKQELAACHTLLTEGETAPADLPPEKPEKKAKKKKKK